MDEPQKPSAERGRASGFFVGPLLVLPLLYALSTGPASYLQLIGVIDETTLDRAYYPLDRIEEFFPSFGYAMELYRERCISWASWLMPQPQNQRPPVRSD
jgi:hypothetical protein